LISTGNPDSAIDDSLIAGLRRPLVVVVGIPALNEEKTIARVVLESQRYSNIVVVCDDGSEDLTAEIAERLGAVVIRHDNNLGYGAALQSLFKRARELKADLLVTLDADGQHNPAEIPRLIKPIEGQVADVVLGSRFMDKIGTVNMPIYRQIGVKVITKLSKGNSKSNVSDAQSGFRAYSKHAMEELGTVCEDGMSASIEIIRAIRKKGLRVCEVPVSCKYGNDLGVEKSTTNPITQGVGLIMSLVRLIVEDKPTTYLGIPGIVFLVVGILFGVWMINIYAAAHHIVTNIALASIAFVFIGFFMISTSITLYAIARIAKKS
jgi:glycosyltransferase involved in cell wall biosynthesis